MQLVRSHRECPGYQPLIVKSEKPDRTQEQKQSIYVNDRTTLAQTVLCTNCDFSRQANLPACASG